MKNLVLQFVSCPDSVCLIQFDDSLYIDLHSMPIGSFSPFFKITVPCTELLLRRPAIAPPKPVADNVTKLIGCTAVS